jgi:hypothetical protein
MNQGSGTRMNMPFLCWCVIFYIERYIELLGRVLVGRAGRCLSDGQVRAKSKKDGCSSDAQVKATL